VSAVRRWPRRALWLRFALFGTFLGSLPFTWTVETSSGCGPPGAPTPKTGWELVSHEPKLTLLLGAMALVSLLLLVLADDVRASRRAAAHAVGALVTGALCFLMFFAATFTLFARIKLFAAAFVGLACLALATLEALARASGELVELWRERRRRAAGDTPADARPD
jgi:hypothetical protein